MKQKILSYFEESSKKDLAAEMKKISAFIDLAIVESFRKNPEDQLPFIVKQMMSLKEYLGSETSFVLTQKENKKSILELFEKEATKKKESVLEEEQLSQENLSEIDQLTSQKEEGE